MLWRNIGTSVVEEKHLVLLTLSAILQGQDRIKEAVYRSPGFQLGVICAHKDYVFPFQSVLVLSSLDEAGCVAGVLVRVPFPLTSPNSQADLCHSHQSGSKRLDKFTLDPWGYSFPLEQTISESVSINWTLV